MIKKMVTSLPIAATVRLWGPMFEPISKWGTMVMRERKYYEDDEEGEKYPKDDDVDGDEWQKEDNGDYK